MKILPMTTAFAAEISTWTYPDEYSVYSFQPSNELTEELLSGDYVACVDEKEQLLGYFCYGAAARIPTVEKDVYDEDHLDIGLGLRPELCGKGLGETFVQHGVTKGEEAISRPYRLSVAAFNQRAIKVYERCGFIRKRSVTHRFSKAEFYIMIR